MTLLAVASPDIMRVCAVTHAALHAQCRPMNALVGELGLSSWKAIASALLLPPVPFLLLALWGALLLWSRRGLGWLVTLASLLGLWLSACAGFGQLLSQLMLAPPPALSAARIDALRREAHANHNLAIIVLGGGREVLAPEYGLSSLTPEALERLRFGVWLGRETGIPVGFSGGNGFGRNDGASEAQIAGTHRGQRLRPTAALERGGIARHARERGSHGGAAAARGDQEDRARHARLAHAARAARVRGGGARPL